ncbi:MAG TPA: hypothetical protein VKD72_22140 [Gemmataceae bacterium]|nr:hypothetical protein [Gemmataceae bacterium]
MVWRKVLGDQTRQPDFASVSPASRSAISSVASPGAASTPAARPGSCVLSAVLVAAGPRDADGRQGGGDGPAGLLRLALVAFVAGRGDRSTGPEEGEGQGERVSTEVTARADADIVDVADDRQRPQRRHGCPPLSPRDRDRRRRLAVTPRWTASPAVLTVIAGLAGMLALAGFGHAGMHAQGSGSVPASFPLAALALGYGLGALATAIGVWTVQGWALSAFLTWMGLVSALMAGQQAI